MNTDPLSADIPSTDVPSADLLDGFLRQAGRVPDRTALVVGERSVTYRELDTATASLARRLLAAGVRPGQTVVVYQQQSLDTLIGMIAAQRAAAAWCVIEPGPGGEASLGALLAAVDCGAVIIDGRDPLTPGGVAAAVADATGGPPLLDVAVRAESSEMPLPGRPLSRAPAYAITTSGSTGVPKVVVVSRANLATLIGSRDYPYTDGELVTFSAMRLIWDGSLMALAWALTVGGTSVLPDARTLRDADAVAALARRHAVTHLVATPSFYRLLLPRLVELRSTLRIVTLAGEALPARVVDEHREILPAAALYNEYGPTEATVTCIVHTVADIPRQLVPIGRPTAGSTAHLLDDRLRPVRSGTRGDLYLGGGQITDGYAAQPGLTATRFVADPFATAPGSRMYLTGDLARTDAHGDIEFHGRADSQLKVRGVRIERGAVETVLEAHPAVREAVVLPVTDVDDTVYLAGFWVPVDSTAVPPASSALAEFCAERLMPEAVPARFVPIDALPIAAGSSKLDESALRALLHKPVDRQPVSRDEWSEAERAIGAIWSEVLLHDEFDREDRFLDVGGNSHRVVALHMRLEARWPGTISVGLLFDLDTVAAQAAALPADPAHTAEPAAAADIPLAFEV
ncbi:non-ribosomal peptide synthetase [Nocardia otitidiscaviarum]|uniref:non-ribosomal peptide synthetase n=1 Tax=Nocardia otitidiscaviarum TaxID=1823 RepID=UPI00189303CD|nr:non-ribosomal peptide synthetase [Nocardia otitidiscaviarum]MBF6177818.1 non-ribosomal peptide synthetase [Nocardia otitidiscaviarum]